MPEYIEREETVSEMLDAMCGTGYQQRAIDVINRQPAADVVEVCRCKDCGYFKRSVSALFPETNCFICDSPYGMKRNIKETDYCSCGERVVKNG